MGLGLSFYRRFVEKVPRFFTNPMDRYTLVLLAVIMISGFLLEGAKIVSYDRYQQMVEDYADADGEEDLRALESLWVAHYGVVSPRVKKPFEPAVLDRGRELNDMSCVACHAPPQWAFLSYGLSRAMAPAAQAMDRMDVSIFLWGIHFLACFIGLAYLPHSRMFHVFVSPMVLLANSVMDPERSDPANTATRQMMELDACTHCGTCTTHCSVGIVYEAVRNVNVLPSEKIAPLKRWLSGATMTDESVKEILEGLYLCTNCHRCTDVCPVGINLQALWFNAREMILQRGYPEVLVFSPLSVYRGMMKKALAGNGYGKPVLTTKKALDERFNHRGDRDEIFLSKDMDTGFKKHLSRSSLSETYSYCFTCKTCTVACPVVRGVADPPGELGLTPHQIMRAAAVGLPDPIFRSGMLWKCLGCYQCQDHCPQGVRVTDILCEIKNLAVKQVKEKMSKRHDGVVS
jgi:heterodisulfide reductase subunit C